MKNYILPFAATLILAVLAFPSCSLIDGDDKPLGGEPSPMGEVNTSYGITALPNGVTDADAVVTARNGEVSTITYSATITNPAVLEMISAMPDVTVSGNRASVSRDYRITTKGFQSVYEEGNLTIMDYDAKEGDTYSLKHNGKKLERKVSKVSKEDVYEWGFFLIKTIHVQETGRGIPGVSKIEFIGIHKWGMVGLKVYFEDGTDQTFGIISSANN
ncbi:hypothetical protein SAMN05444280_11758 [Tangfeifania diversioriginum]|uniref:Uncharacterized protein n=1 Tax=Tangfeifania diversioriginum TaxID=1168035 RepID=A0A1M6IMY1_9BACT|nr:hypothetical protein [Tangfeifania diversioriginum]SHJ35856.1 hypothetical protein SAMN05444280_11758 [Tangfeifania diversioriginum]